MRGSSIGGRCCLAVCSKALRCGGCCDALRDEACDCSDDFGVAPEESLAEVRAVTRLVSLDEGCRASMPWTLLFMAVGCVLAGEAAGLRRGISVGSVSFCGGGGGRSLDRPAVGFAGD